ncbi:MAG: hypothetical protein S0880_32630 [Actinomycetota bacterium]|nr:hypothetical protein [Actinomycetota bacterium]
MAVGGQVLRTAAKPVLVLAATASAVMVTGFARNIDLASRMHTTRSARSPRPATSTVYAVEDGSTVQQEDDDRRLALGKPFRAVQPRLPSLSEIKRRAAGKARSMTPSTPEAVVEVAHGEAEEEAAAELV